MPGSQRLGTPEGRYLHDWRDHNLGVAYESVELNPTPDLDLSKVGAWVNYFEGKVSPVHGVVVVLFNGQSSFGEFTVTAPGGNKAGEKDKRDQSRYWVRLNLADLVKSGTKFCPTGAAQ
jgi:hypothetical protein